MLGRVSGGFLQGNPVYDFDENDYVGAYMQDEWKVRAEPHAQRRPAVGTVSADQELARLRQQLRQGALRSGARSRVYPQAPPACSSPATTDFPGNAVMNGKLAQFAPRARRGLDAGRRQTAIRAGWGIFYDTPHLFFNTRFANNPPWGAQITLTESGGRLHRSVPQTIQAAIRSRRWRPTGRRSPSPRSASTSTRRSTRSRRRCSSGTSARSGRSATGWCRPAISATTRTICGGRPS